MRIAIVSGTSRGIGYELAKNILSAGGKVLGISRSNSNLVEEFSQNYYHFSCDLSQGNELQELIPKIFQFPFQEASELILINNAGLLTPIGPSFTNSIDSVVDSVNVNLISLMTLTNSFIKHFENSNIKKKVIHISSGAAVMPIFGWSTYCATKAAVEMYTKVVNEEQKIATFPVKSYAVRPGIIDTSMQSLIRKQSKANFKDVEQFIAYHENKELKTPEMSGKELFDTLVAKDPKEELLSL